MTLVRPIQSILAVTSPGQIPNHLAGQISGFLEMQYFLEKFADVREPKLAFSNVRSGLIVSLVSVPAHEIP